MANYRLLRDLCNKGRMQFTAIIKAAHPPKSMIEGTDLNVWQGHELLPVYTTPETIPPADRPEGDLLHYDKAV